MNGQSWEGYLDWSGLRHLTEVISLDGILNQSLVEPDYDDPDDWNFLHVFGHHQTGLYTSLDYVLKRMKGESNFNLLTVAMEPDQVCNSACIEGFEFIGYDLLDQDFAISPLTNCRGIKESFLPIDLNEKGLIDEYAKAYDIKKRLLENDPDVHHADTNVFAIWRHKSIGQ